MSYMKLIPWNEIEWPYHNHYPNDDIIFSDELLRLKTNSKSLEIHGSLLLTFIPHARLLIKINASPEVAISIFLNATIVQIEVDRYNICFDAILLQLTDNGIILCPTKEPLLLGKGSDDLTKVRFYIPNYVNFFGDQVVVLVKAEENTQRYTRLGAITLEIDEWELNLFARSDISTIKDILKSTGGYGVTHLGLLKRKDGKSFTFDKTSQLFTALYYYLSFCRGFFSQVHIYV